MAHEIAKAVLEQAKTPVQRVKAIRVANQLGMPLHLIEQYLDWLDAVGGGGRMANGQSRTSNVERRTSHAEGPPSNGGEADIER